MEQTLVVVKRGDHVESRHAGHIAVVNSEGRLLHAVGNAERQTFARSALKPFQTLPLVQSGAAERFLMNGKELAICCGSHNGQEEHVQTVNAMLARLGLEEHHLQCGAHAPYDEASSHALIAAGRSPGAIHNNCSGKHAGMLAQALHLQSDIASYFKAEHPVQQLVLRTLIELTGLETSEVASAIDGCGIPTFGIPLRNLAHLYSLLANPSTLQFRPLRLAMEQVHTAMTTYPEMVGGTDVLCTDLMRLLKGRVIAKGGAEGVYCLGLPERGIGIAIKIEDGHSRAAYPVAVETLRQLNVIDEEERAALLSDRLTLLRNRRREAVGVIEPVFKLT